MHSRIFQLNTDNDAELMDEHDFMSDFEWFVGEIADYVTDTKESDWESNIRWLAECIPEECKDFFEIGIDRTGKYIATLTIKPHFANEYFKDRFELLKEEVNQLTLEEFSGERDGVAMYRISQCMKEKFGFYVVFDEELMTFDDLVRTIARISPDKDLVCYFGSVLDYHY